MHSEIRKRAALVAGVMAVAMVGGGLAWATPGSGTTSNPIGRATFEEPVHLVRKGAEGWRVHLDAKEGLDVATQAIVFQPGGQSGWHRHPGPVLVSVVSGTMTFYESTDPRCSPIVVRAGEGYSETGRHAHIGRNETSEPAMVVVTYLVPKDAPALRLDAPDPGTCSF